MTRAIAVLVASAAALVASPGGATAQAPDARQTAKLKFTSKDPGTPTGLTFKVDYVNPADPAAKPPAVVQVVEKLARGARFDTTVPAACTASDPALMLLGPSACPSGSQVAEGVITLDTGLPQPGRFLTSPAVFFNNLGEFIFLNQVLATESPRVVSRARVHRRSYVSDAPFLPGTPPDGAAVDTVQVDGFEVTRDGGGDLRSYVTTPPRCPKRGYWVNRATFTYFDGVAQTVKTRSRCRRQG